MPDNAAQQNNASTLWAEVINVWQHGFMGVDIGSIIVAMGIFLAFLILRGLLSKYILYKLHQWAAKTSTKIDDKIVDALIPPIRFIPLILGVFFASSYLDFGDGVDTFFNRILRSMIAFGIFWAIYRASEPMGHSFGKVERVLSRPMMQWIFKVLRVLVVFVGGAVILEIWGIAVGPLLAGLGLFGAAIALGAQDLFKNLIGGLTIIAEKRFQPGEWIKVDGIVEGTVEDIGFRSTKVRRFDKAPVHVPNASLSDAVVTNFSRMTHRRIKWKIGVKYGTSVEQLKIIRDGIEAYILENDAFAAASEVSTFVRVDSFNDSSIDFLIYCFTKTTNWGEWLAIKEKFAIKIKEIVENEAKTGFAFPSQSLYVEQWPEDTPETFLPSKGTEKAA